MPLRAHQLWGSRDGAAVTEAAEGAGGGRVTAVSQLLCCALRPARALAMLQILARSWEVWGLPVSSAVLQTAGCDQHGRVEVSPSVCLKEDDK